MLNVIDWISRLFFVKVNVFILVLSNLMALDKTHEINLPVLMRWRRIMQELRRKQGSLL